MKRGLITQVDSGAVGRLTPLANGDPPDCESLPSLSSFQRIMCTEARTRNFVRARPLTITLTRQLRFFIIIVAIAISLSGFSDGTEKISGAE